MLKNERWNERKTDSDGNVRWNGHTWTRRYQCGVKKRMASFVMLSCSHWVDTAICKGDLHFCPRCGRLIIADSSENAV